MCRLFCAHCKCDKMLIIVNRSLSAAVSCASATSGKVKCVITINAVKARREEDSIVRKTFTSYQIDLKDGSLEMWLRDSLQASAT